MREGWTYKRLGEITTTINGLWTGKKPPFINIAVVRNTNFTKDCELEMNDVAYIDVEQKQYSTRKLFPGDIIIEKSGGTEKQPVGRAVLFNIKDGEYSFSNFTAALRIVEDCQLLPTFLHKFLKAKYRQGITRSMQSKTTGIHNLDLKAYKNICIPLPTIETQQSIVAEFDKINELIGLKKSQLNDLDSLAQSIFYEMFGDPVENEKGWEVSCLADMGELARGVSKHRPRNAPELLGGSMPLIQTGDVANADMYIRDFHSTYSDLGVSQSKIWKAGTLCVTIAATIGKCAILDFDACFPDSVVGFAVNKERCNNEYVYFIFKSLQSILEENAPAVAQKNINLKVLNNLEIPLPPLPLQQSFAARITAIEQQKQRISESIKDLETLLASRMQYWFD